MRRVVGGRTHHFPTYKDGKVDMSLVRRETGINPDEIIIGKKANGENDMLPRNGRVNLEKYIEITKAPRVKRG